MKKEDEKNFSLRVDADTLVKFRYVCNYHGRSANSQLVQLMLRTISAYEKEHEEIIITEEIRKKYSR